MATETGLIKSVEKYKDWFQISYNGYGIGLKTKYGVIPKVGDTITVHTKGGTFGTIRGIEINDKMIFHKSDEELEQDRKDWLKKNEEDKQKEFLKNKKNMDKQYEALPKCFKDRIDRLRANNDRFRIDYESYELFCCEQAVIIADALKTPKAIEIFRALDWEKQKENVKDLSEDHSGNTFGVSCALAHFYLENPDNVSKLHGALSPLVGSKEYGDIKK